MRPNLGTPISFILGALGDVLKFEHTYFQLFKHLSIPPLLLPLLLSCLLPSLLPYLGSIVRRIVRHLSDRMKRLGFTWSRCYRDLRVTLRHFWRKPIEANMRICNTHTVTIALPCLHLLTSAYICLHLLTSAFTSAYICLHLLTSAYICLLMRIMSDKCISSL